MNSSVNQVLYCEPSAKVLSSICMCQESIFKFGDFCSNAGNKITTCAEGNESCNIIDGVCIVVGNGCVCADMEAS